MGNHIFHVANPPPRGQKVFIKDSTYTTQQEFPQSVMQKGTPVIVLGSKNLMCSRPNAPKITASLVKFPNGSLEVLLTNNLA